MEIINGKSLSEMCDYSFGDHLGFLNPKELVGGFMKDANRQNREFLEECKKYEGRIMTLFIDNIRLYNRPIWANEGNDARWVEYLLTNNDLLDTCGTLTKNKFVIFTSHEDTPIDEHIKLPPNVLGIHATNAIYNDDKVVPFPYGLQRPIERDIPDNRLAIMKQLAEEDAKVTPTKLLYINCGIGRNPERKPLEAFEGLDWATTRFNKDSMFFPYNKYREFIAEMRDHKFMICPEGHGIDCHRNWELLYMRRVPVMKKSPYFARLMAGFPVLFVEEWSDVTKELLEANEHLFQEAQTMDINKLDLSVMFKDIMAKYAN